MWRLATASALLLALLCTAQGPPADEVEERERERRSHLSLPPPPSLPLSPKPCHRRRRRPFAHPSRPTSCPLQGPRYCASGRARQAGVHWQRLRAPGACLDGRRTRRAITAHGVACCAAASSGAASPCVLPYVPSTCGTHQGSVAPALPSPPAWRLCATFPGCRCCECLRAPTRSTDAGVSPSDGSLPEVPCT